MVFQKSIFSTGNQDGGKTPSGLHSDGTEFAKSQNFFFHRNKDLYLLFYPRLSLILCFFAFKLFFFSIFVKCFWQFGYAKLHSGVITNLQSLSPGHTGQPIVC